MKSSAPFRVLLVLLAVLAGARAARAGDLLRGGAAPGQATVGATSGAGAAGSGTVIPSAASLARDSLARTTQALQAMQALQAAARAAAQTGSANLGADPNHSGLTLPNVPDGLTAGGLAVAPGGIWQGAGLPVQTAANGQTTVTVTQSAQQALLNWTTFNVGRATTLVFDQSAGGASQGEWIAFNKINDPSGLPSQILGSIQAGGQVYVINQNGIIFGGASQVNTHALVASSLPINDNLVTLGLLNNADQQFLFSSLPIAAGANGTPAFNPAAANTPGGQSGDVTVQPGAQLSAPTTADHVGGRVALVGPNVTNGGTITTPDGQTILAAGRQVGMAAHSTSDPSLRGLDVNVGTVDATSGTVANTGLVEAPRASVVLTGATVNQLGAIDSSTSVAFNGRIDLLANYNAVSSGGVSGVAPFFPTSAGTVTLGPASVTQILPELASSDRVTGTQLALPSQLNLQGLVLSLAGNSAGAATLYAPGAAVAFNAGNWNLAGSGISAVNQFVFTGGQISLAAGARIDVSGSPDVSASVAENIVQVQLLGAELANSPLQRSGVLRGQTIAVDISQTGTYNGQTWIGTPLADASGYVALIQRSVGELTVAGGSVALNAGQSVTLQPGSAVNVSGGWIDYQGATVGTTKLLSGGHVIDIAKATPDLVYSGIYTPTVSTTDPKWGVTLASTAALTASTTAYQPGYLQGGSAGSVTITAPAMTLGGTLLGVTVAGPRQRTTVPVPAALSLAFQGQSPSGSVFLTTSPASPPAIFIQAADSPLAPGGFALDSAYVNTDGFGRLSLVNTDGSITVPAGTALTTPVGGSITLAGANLDIEGRVTAPGGSLSFTAEDISQAATNALDPNAAHAPPADPTRGRFTLGPAAVLSTAGLVVDDRTSSPTANSLPLATAGGSIAIKAYSATLSPGSVLDVSGGDAVGTTGKSSYGNGGTISVSAGQDPGYPSLGGGQLVFEPTLRGYSGAAGGALALLAPLVQVGGTPANAGTLLLAPAFFSQGGFTRFTLNGLAEATPQNVPALLVAPGTVLAPVAQSWLAQTDSGQVDLIPTLLPAGVRQPVSLTLAAVRVPDYRTDIPTVQGDLLLGAGAVIQTDPKGAVSLAGDTVTVLGSVLAPGGTIAVSGGKDSTKLFQTSQVQALPTVVLGASSLLSAAGTTVLTPDPRGYRTGSVLAGGTINVAGNLVALPGARLDVSGAADTLDLLPAYSGITDGLNTGVSLSAFVPTPVASNGGAITLGGAQELFTDATLLGAAGGSAATGGSLTVSSGRFYAPGGTATPLDVTLQVTQGVLTQPGGAATVGTVVTDGNGVALPALGHVAVSRFAGGGFNAVTLRGVVQFTGPVAIAATGSLKVADGGVLFADSPVSLTAPYVVLGTPFQGPLSLAQLQQQVSAFTLQGLPYYFPPTYGPGTLTVAASHIDLGDLSLQTTGQANFLAAGGDIRGDGTVDVAGVLALTAGQIYPPTDVNFTLAAYDYSVGGVTHPGTVSVAASGSRQLPLSAGGTLDVFGSVIAQGGVLRAPIGTINLGWDGVGTAPVDAISGTAVGTTQRLTLASGSVTSVSAVDPATGQALTIPYGTNLNGTAWIDPSGTDITAGGVPGKSVNLSAASLAVSSGASVDISGGGDLYAYRFVAGTGGSTDILASSTAFAVLPGYQADYAPFDPGYANASVAVGDRVFLNASTGLPAGIYTLLPARYALLPGAFLVTPQSGTPAATAVRPDGSSLVAGYRFNDLNAARTGTPLFSDFEVAPAGVVQARAEYDGFSANSFLAQGALASNAAVPRLPVDAGQLVLVATQAMSVQGAVTAQAPAGGRGGLVDLSSPVDILIAAPGVTGPANTLVLDATKLSAFGAESLLIGGIRESTPQGTDVVVGTGRLTVDNAGAPLTGPDLILVANNQLTLAAGSEVKQTGALTGPAETLLLGSAATAGSGNGLLVRVSADPAASIVRSGVTGAAGPALGVGANAKLSGTSVTLDSTGATSLDSSAVLAGSAVALDSGQISLQLTTPGPLQPTTGLVLSGGALQTLQTGAQSLSLLSYTSLDLYGTGEVGALGAGGQPLVASLALHAAEIRGFNAGGGTVTFAAQHITLDNSPGGTAPATVAAPSGTLAFDAGTLQLGANQLAVAQYTGVALNATGGILVSGTGGLSTPGALSLTTPLLTGATGATQTICSGGALTLLAPVGGSPAIVSGGLGASLTLAGVSVSAGTGILLPSGTLTLQATAGDVLIGGQLDAGGTAQSFYDLTKFTDAGQISLFSDTGSVTVAAGGVVNVAAATAGGNAGRVAISAPAGVFTAAGALQGSGGTGGTFTADVGSLANLAALDPALNLGGFSRVRSIRVRTGDVALTDTTTAGAFSLSADQGSITVTGTVDASGMTGGSISLAASGSVTVASGARLTVAAQNFNDAGKGGAVTIEAGDEINGVVSRSASLNIQSGSTIDLSVASNTAASAGLGDFTGTLHLRAPQNTGATDLQVAPLNGTILGASGIAVEGYKLFDLTAATATISSTVETNVFNNGTAFGAATPAISSRLLANNAALAPSLVVVPGAEIINRTGDLVLASSWDLSTFRFGPNSLPGVLTLRAAGNLNFLFKASLSDGFTSSTYAAPLLAVGAPSWSYRLVAGADFTAADFQRVKPLASLAAGSGSLLLGTNATPLPTATNNSRSSIIPNFYQVIRTGTGDITIAAGRDVELLNPLATIYTAGTQAAALANFALPNLNYQNSNLGGAQTTLYPAQYTLGGGDVTIAAQNDITSLVLSAGVLVPDSTRELPDNWLYRRGYVNPATDQFGSANGSGEIQSTSWWVDFSNFFEGVGALGGGSVTLTAGRDVSNVDAVVPTNARMPQGTPATAGLVELGGGDLTVSAGRDINGGVYYVERGQGVLTAGGSIHSNSTRAALTQSDLAAMQLAKVTPDPVTWLPTTLFLGQGAFDVTAHGDLLLGPVANPFLLPQGINNSFYEKTYFSTYAPTDTVAAVALVGSVTLKDNADGGAGSLQSWYQNVLLFTGNPKAFSVSQPWLRLAETKVTPFATVTALLPPTLQATAFAGDVNLVGSLTFAPAPLGTVELAAAGSVNGTQVNSLTSLLAAASVTNLYEWGSATIDLSDADPARLPGIASPLSLASVSTSRSNTGGLAGSWSITPAQGLLDSLNSLFAESGATQGTNVLIQTQQALHAAGPLHATDPSPVRLYSAGGDISGLTLYAGKSADVVAALDLTDLSLYLQNNRAAAISLVAAGRDLIAYDPNSPLRLAAQAAGNQLLPSSGSTPGPGTGNPTAGDLQLGGPGTFEVLAGRDFNLGVGTPAADGTGAGLATIGNTRNPNLPFAGASIIAGAGMGGTALPDFTAFNAEFLNPATAGAEAALYLPTLGSALGLPAGTGLPQLWTAFNALPAARRDQLSLGIFYLVLRDAGRNHLDPTSPAYKFQSGFAAITALFPGTRTGDLTLTSRAIKTTSGGDISLFAPGGQLTVGLNVAGGQSADQGILTEHGGDISIFTGTGVNVGTSRIFTLRGGNEIIWASAGNIAAGAASKTVQAAPPTRVLIDPQSGDVKTDLAGLATGGGIGVLASVAGVAPGDVDLVAPTGTIDAGDAGIRSSGRLNVSAVQVLNASNIQSGGASTGVPVPAAAPSLGGLAAAVSSSSAATSGAAAEAARNEERSSLGAESLPSLITVEVLGYGGGSDDNTDPGPKTGS